MGDTGFGPSSGFRQDSGFQQNPGQNTGTNTGFQPNTNTGFQQNPNTGFQQNPSSQTPSTGIPPVQFTQGNFQEQFNVLYTDVGAVKRALQDAQWQLSLATQVLQRSELTPGFWQGGRDTSVCTVLHNYAVSLTH
jgi:hypothetical protein